MHSNEDLTTVTHTGNNTAWQVIFVENQKALRIKFCGFKFRDSNLVQGHGTALMMM